MKKQNVEIREACKRGGVRLWQLAERIGLTDAQFSRRLRREFDESEKNNLLAIISELSEELAEEG